MYCTNVHNVKHLLSQYFGIPLQPCMMLIFQKMEFKSKSWSVCMESVAYDACNTRED